MNDLQHQMKHKKNLRMIARRPTLLNDKAVELQLWIDADDLLTWMGNKATQSKRGRSQIASGAVVVKIFRF